MNILLTGAAGLLGGEVCMRLVERGHRVTALIHKSPEIRANDGTLVGVQTVHGDVAQPQFGLDDAAFSKVADDHDLLIHCAATVRFDLAEDDYRAVNVDGVANALALAERGEMDVLHVSTAYVCGRRDGPIGERDPLPDTGFANGYEASKAAGERLVRASRTRWAIARPSIVVGEYETGRIRQFDTTYAAFKLIAEGRVRHMPASTDATLNFVPIDYVAQSIVKLADRMEQAAGRTLHLVSGQPLPVAAFTGAIGSYPQFHEPELVPPYAFDPAALPAMERRLFKRVAGLYATYFQRDPHFDDSETRRLLRGGCPPTGEPYIRRLIDYCIRAGFLDSA